MSFRLVTVFALLVFPLVVHATEPLTLQFSERGVSASAVTPRGQVVLFGVAREPSDTRPAHPRSVCRVVMLTDDDGDGAVHHDLGQDVAAARHVGGGRSHDGRLRGGAFAGLRAARIVITPDVARHDNNGPWPDDPER